MEVTEVIELFVARLDKDFEQETSGVNRNAIDRRQETNNLLEFGDSSSNIFRSVLCDDEYSDNALKSLSGFEGTAKDFGGGQLEHGSATLIGDGQATILVIYFIVQLSVKPLAGLKIHLRKPGVDKMLPGTNGLE